MNKTTFPLGVLVLTIALLTALSLTACDPAPDNNGTPQPHESTITAFDRTIMVIGDGSISLKDFDNAKAKLQEAMILVYEGVSGAPSIVIKFTVMLDRSGFNIIIQTGNTGPVANANKSMTIGVDYLLNNDVETSAEDILTKVYIDNAFADPYTPLYTNPATITLSFVASSGAPGNGNFNVTVKSDDTYLPNVWDGLVESVKTALETTYASPDVDAGDRGDLRDVFGVAGATVILKKDLATNWEVKAGTTKGVLYIKTGAISNIPAKSYGAAATSMSINNPSTSQD